MARARGTRMCQILENLNSVNLVFHEWVACGARMLGLAGAHASHGLKLTYKVDLQTHGTREDPFVSAFLQRDVVFSRDSDPRIVEYAVFPVCTVYRCCVCYGA